jgi:hypothetical protein
MRLVAHVGRAGWKDWNGVRYACDGDFILVTNNASDVRASPKDKFGWAAVRAGQIGTILSAMSSADARREAAKCVGRDKVPEPIRWVAAARPTASCPYRRQTARTPLVCA